MSINEAEFFKELLSMFKIEAEEHLKVISTHLLDLEKTKDPEAQKALVEVIYREVHSLKGAARAVNINPIETLCQSLEDIFSAIKRRVLVPLPEHFDVLHASVDSIGKLIESPESVDISPLLVELGRLEEQKQKEPEKKVEKVEKENHIEEVKSPEPSPPVAIESTPSISSEGASGETVSNAIAGIEKSIMADTIRIPTSKLDSIFLQAEEFLSFKLFAQHHAIDQRELVGTLEMWRKEWEKRDSEIRTYRRELENRKKEGDGEVEGLLNVFDFLSWNFQQLKRVETRTHSLWKSQEGYARNLGTMVDGLLEEMKQILMMPFSTLLKLLPKVVRDLSRDKGKEVELIVKGSTIEVDRRILEEMKDPFIHLIRNCIDHGIEKPEERIQKKKNRCGVISIAITQISGNKIEILVSDDGRGVDVEKVKASALKTGLYTKETLEKLSESEIRMLIFQSDISTSPIITDISGRGLGLPIVREKVEKLGGSISLDTVSGKGTTFRIQLPITLATFRGVLVEVNDHWFVIPTLSVERVLRVHPNEIKTIENSETIVIDGKTVSLVHLADVLGLPRTPMPKERGEFLPVVVLSSGDRRVAYVVHRILNEQEVLVKSLGKQLVRVKNIAGATILGSNRVVPILNVADLMKSAVKAAQISMKIARKTEEVEVGQKSILVVEDSITSRTLLKNILESAGYRVKTSVDGVDALTALQSETFDLVVSDIEMPRMNGFDLVAKIRSDKKIADLPVILVTALESREDRERGIDVGANAYIVKRSFDQSNLLEVIEKLI